MTTLRIAMNGVTGRMGYRQHLVRSILPIRDQGGVTLPDGSRVQVEPVLVGRNADKLTELATLHDVEHWTTDLDTAIGDADIIFDAAMTNLRAATLSKAMRQGKHVYTEKPTAETLAEAIELARLQAETGVTVGVVHDKLYLPGLVKLRRLVDEGFFGRILSLRGEFGYWVFEGDSQAAQRPSWNYRKEDGGGMTTDMFCHWNYVLEGILGQVKTVTAKTVTHIPTRWDESGKEYAATADDAAYGIFDVTTPGGDDVVAQINSSWAVRVFRDELVEFQVDGTHGSAVAGLRECRAQHRAHTPKPVWNPDLPVTEPFRDQWLDVPANGDLDNGFKLQWEEFLTDVVAGRAAPLRPAVGGARRAARRARPAVLRRGPQARHAGDRAVTGAQSRCPCSTARGGWPGRRPSSSAPPDRGPRRRARSPPASPSRRPTWCRSRCGEHPGRARRRRLGLHARLPAPHLGARSRRRRRDGHRAARHGAGLGGDAGARAAVGGRGRLRGRPRRVRRGHRPAHARRRRRAGARNEGSPRWPTRTASRCTWCRTPERRSSSWPRARWRRSPAGPRTTPPCTTRSSPTPSSR